MSCQKIGCNQKEELELLDKQLCHQCFWEFKKFLGKDGKMQTRRIPEMIGDLEDFMQYPKEKFDEKPVLVDDLVKKLDEI